MSRLPGVLRLFGLLVLLGGLLGGLAAAGLWLYFVPLLPSIEILKDVRLQVPLRVYTRDGKLLAEFGEKRRVPLHLAQVPPLMTKAVIAAEDERFYEHPGVDWQGITRAVLHLVRTGEKGPGGSTITMQVARNFFLGREKTYTRKFKEILLALKIEHELTKDEILELYLNKVFLGHRAYGFGAAAQVYYGKKIGELTLPQFAMIAGLPKAPSRYNPIVNPDRAISRRNYVLGRMRALGFIGETAYEEARAAPVTASLHGLPVEVEAPYVAEMVRSEMEARYGDEAYTAGLQVYTTLDSRLQEAANSALRGALVAYDERHGWRGPELQLPAVLQGTPPEQALADVPVVGGLAPAVVLAAEGRSLTVYAKGTGRIVIPWQGIEWARRYIDDNHRGKKPESAADVAKRGDVVRVRHTADGWRLTQLPAVEGALVSLDPEDGSILALTGGFDFYRSKFNRVMQAERQPGSSFKPFIYSSALDKGYTAASLINDAPVVFNDPSLEAAWRPENYSGKFFGPTRLREGLYESRNLVSIRLLRAIGIDWALAHIRRFGFDVDRLPHNLSLALGSGTVKPIELARGYAVLANGGFLVDPYFIDRVVDSDGVVLSRADPRRVCRTCEQPAPNGGAPGATAPAAGAPVAPAAAGAAPTGAAAATGPAASGAAVRVADSRSAPGATPAAPTGASQGESATPPDRVAPRVVGARNDWLMNSLMRDVIRRGTGRRALALGRKDLAGKTGTTNDQRDAWFSGFNPRIVATCWVGFDQVAPLGRHETGARAALPMWMAYMKKALAGMPETFLEQPEGIVSARIDPKTGQLASAANPDAMFEYFRTELAPRRAADATTPTSTQAPAPSPEVVTEQLF